MPSMLTDPLHRANPTQSPPRIVAVGFRRINKMLQALAPEFADRAAVEVLDVGFEEAVAPTAPTCANTSICLWWWSRWGAWT